MSSARGSTLVEALVGVTLAAMAMGVLASGVLVGVRAFSLASGTNAQTVATHDGLERLRASAPGTVTDQVGAVPPIDRRRASSDGRGRPHLFHVACTFAGGHRFAVASEHQP